MPSTVKQLAFGFVATMDRELAIEAKRQREYWKKKNSDYNLKVMVEQLPPIDSEIEVVQMGIRMARHVHDDECERCKLGTFNHCPDTLPRHWYHDQWCPTKVCLKDYFRWCAQHGRKDLVQEILQQ